MTPLTAILDPPSLWSIGVNISYTRLLPDPSGPIAGVPPSAPLRLCALARTAA
jgi:hypothetical protein